MTPHEAIFHLSLLGMYADGNIAETEDTRISHLLDELGWPEDSGERGLFVAAAFSRVRGAAVSDEATAAFLTGILKPALGGEEMKIKALFHLKTMLEADNVTTDKERNLLSLASWML